MNTLITDRDTPSLEERSIKKLLTFPDHNALVLSIRAKALIFCDPKSEALLEQVEKIAQSDATALIIGQTGTGKELIARHIHDQSRRKGPFIAVNCGALSESLIESELFGHESGTFTGASQSRIGWFEAANGGTLFLDEIGDLPLSMQVKLLRVLQEREVVRLGARKSIPIDIRLVAATNVDLARAVSAGHFRTDLFYRLNVVTLDLPPLHERPGDILPLANHFIEVYRAKLKLPIITVTPLARQALLAYNWPGNIRELENVIHYALIVCRQNTIHVDDLKLSTAPVLEPIQNVAIADKGNKETDSKLKAHLTTLFEQSQPALYHHVERILVKTAFDYCEQNQVRTAQLLGISRNILRAQLKRFGLLEDRRKNLGLKQLPELSSL